MARWYAESDSYNHRCSAVGGSWGGFYQISWTVDYTYSGARLRYPRSFRRVTDERGARRFCKKWELEMPPAPPASRQEAGREE